MSEVRIPLVVKKPPYKPLTMDDVRGAKKRRPSRRVVSLFAGAGGSSLGYRLAGCSVVWVSEFIDIARETYRLNASPRTKIDGRDIREVKPSEILTATKLDVGELDILDGSPPCASFSRSGKREKHWGKVKTYSEGSQRTDDLFFEYARILEGLKPKLFIAENVPGLAVGKAKGYYHEIKAALSAVGYRVEARIVDASRLGVPQARRRMIFVGVRNDLEGEPRFPKPNPWFFSLEDATRDLSIDHVSSPNSTSLILPETAGPTIRRFAIYKQWKETPIGKNHPKRFNLCRPNPKRPCPTITSTTSSIGAAGVAHPTEPRKFSVAELKRIASFPDDFEIPGTYYQQVERIGRAVPPLMMKAIAEAALEVLDA